MSEPLWTAVDDYINSLVVGEDAALTGATAACAEAGLPSIAVAPNQGKLLHLLARLHGARRILEIGTLGGYSTIWLARALPEGGRLVTLEADPKHAEVARVNIANAGLGEVVELRLGRAIETLPLLEAEKAGPFDFIFIDADKPSIPDYFQWALKLSLPGGVIIVDNVVRKGALADASSTDEAVVGVRRLHELIATEPRVTATTIQTVGGKGHDGLTIAMIIA